MAEFFSFLGVVIIGGVILTDLLLAIFVYKNNPHSATNKLFTLLSVVISLWLVFNYISVQPSFISSSLLWIRLSFFFATLLSLLFFLLAHTLPDDRIKLKKRTLFALLFVTAVTMLIMISPFAFSSVQIINGSPQPVTGLGMLPFSVLSTIYSLTAVFTLLTKRKNSRGIEREQIRWILLGILIMLGLIISTILFPLLLFKTNIFVSLLPLYTAIFIGMTAYAIIKHKFFDIRALVARSVAYTILVIIIGALYAGALIFIGEYVFGYDFPLSSVVITIIASLLIAYSYQPLLRYVERITDRIFYKNRYDSRFLLAKLSRIMASTLELEELVELILRVIISDVKITQGVIFLTKNKTIEWSKAVAHHGRPSRSADAHSINELMEYLDKKKGQKIIVYDEVEVDRIKKLCKDNGFSIVFPLTVNHRTIGLMAFGEKSSGDVYSLDDIRVFHILAPEIAVAVKNSLQFEEIKRFNITLKDEVKMATHDLRDANIKLKELDQMKDDFVSVASHELRTPMTAIKSYLWLALDGRGGKLTEKQKYYLDRAYISTDRLIKLVNDMLNISRIESGRITIEMNKIDIQQLVQDVIDEVKPRADEVKVKVTLDQPQKKILPVLADPDKIKEVLFNIIGNSLKFTPEKGTITISFESKEDGHVIIHVRDTGRGIDEKDMGTLFTKFGMVEGSYVTNKKASGTGLGLYISKSIIELHKGKIWAQSPGIDQGTTFSFTLPYYKKGDKVVIKPEKSVEDRKLGIIHSGI